MKKVLNFILIAILAFSALKADAVVLSDTQVKSIIANEVKERYSKYTDADLEIRVIAVPFQKLELPSGNVNFVIESMNDKFMAREMEHVSVYVGNKCVKTFNAPIIVKAYMDILVASKNIPREKSIGSDVATVERREISNNMNFVLKANAINNQLVAKKYFVPGEVIDKKFVKLRPDILRNANVTVVFNTNNLTISIEATALSDGVVGENICIMNKNYNKIYKGTVIGENRVLVKI